ncbi:unnamed protein product [Calypogeia fissa]
MNDITERLSQILKNNETKLKHLSATGQDYKNTTKLDRSNLDLLTIHPSQDYLVDLLTERSRQFLEACRELQTITHDQENCKEIIGWDNFLEKASIANGTSGGTSVTDLTESDAEELKMRYNSLVLTLEAQLQETREEVEHLQKGLHLSKVDQDKIAAALSNIPKLETKKLLKTHEQMSQPEIEANSHKLEELQSSMKEVPKILRGRPRKFITNAKINEDLAEVNKTVAKTVNKVCGECGQTRGSNDMKSERYQQEGKSNAHEAERLRLTSSISELTKQLHDQQSLNATFARVNDGLVELNKTQVNQVHKLKQQVRLLQQRLINKSKETIKIAKAHKKAEKAVTLNCKQCENLRSKLEQCKKDLSRYCVEDMTSFQSAT